MQRWFFALAGLATLLIGVPARAMQTIPPAGLVLRLAGATPGHIFAGTWCGIYELSDTAAWTELPGMRDVPGRRLVRLQGDLLLANPLGWWPGGVWRHSPGESWQRVPDVPDGPMAANPAGTHAYLAVPGAYGAPGVLRSDDGGRSWHATTTPSRYGIPSDIAVIADPATGADVVLLGLRAGRVGGSALVRSPDGGTTWQDLPGYTGDVAQSLGPTLFPAAGGAFYAANVASSIVGGSGGTRLYRGSAGGALEPMSLPAELVPDGVAGVAVFDGALLAGGPAGLFISGPSGAGSAFQRYDQGLGGEAIFDLLVTPGSAPGSAGVAYVATSTGVYRRAGGAAAWTPTPPGLPNCTVPWRTVYEPIPPFPDGPDHHFYPETQHSLSYGFKTFWEQNGALPVFGLPLSEEFSERNIDLDRTFTTQYLERERFEYHPENAGTPYTVLLGRLGAELLTAQGRNWRDEGGAANPFGAAGCRLFDTGGLPRTVCGPFLDYWRSHGLVLHGGGGVAYDESLALFGLPLTAPRMETNPDGDRVITQWFERARFEYHPDKPAPYRVLLGRLGAELLSRRGVPAPSSRPGAGR